MVKKLYIGNLAYSVDDESLKGAFARFGTVESATVVKDKTSGRSKGFGFVEMSTEESAAKAIEQMNQSEFEGRKMFVSESHSMNAKSGPRSDGPRSGGPRGDRRFSGRDRQ
jgi:RNA recognition motif-containing protein